MMMTSSSPYLSLRPRPRTGNNPLQSEESIHIQHVQQTLATSSTIANSIAHSFTYLFSYSYLPSPQLPLQVVGD